MTNNTLRLRALVAVSTLGVVLAGASVPAQAAEPASRAASAESAALPSAGSAKTQRAANTKYCFITNVTGTRIEKKVCKTRSEWAREGVDVDAH
jgi:invasion protein IalB